MSERVLKLLQTWVPLLVAVLTLIVLFEQHKLNRRELEEGPS